MVMMRRYLLSAGIVAGILVAVVWAGVSGSGRDGVRWEYGIFRGEGVWTWYAPGVALDNADAGEFASQIHAAYSQKGTELETHVLNSLAAQGWELVAAPEKNKYVLRRMR